MTANAPKRKTISNLTFLGVEMVEILTPET